MRGLGYWPAFGSVSEEGQDPGPRRRCVRTRGVREAWRCGICRGRREEGNLENSLGPALGVGATLAEAGQSRSGSGRGVWQGRSRQQTPRQRRMSEQEDRIGVMVTFQGRTSHTSPVLPPQLFLLHRRRKPWEFKLPVLGGFCYLQPNPMLTNKVSYR